MPLSSELKAEILEALHRSGYLLESRIVRVLYDEHFFVEPNVAVLDPRTGKSRELDIIAEYFDYDPERPNVSVKTQFAIEALNNPFPLVLLTPHPWSPNEDPVTSLRFATTPEAGVFEDALDLYGTKVSLDRTYYSQYCALSRKKASDELMASHPDDLYSSLLKLAEFTEHEFGEFETRQRSENDAFWRLWFWQAILVVGGDLLVAAEDEDALQVTEVNDGTLVFNFHAAGQPRTLLIHVVREAHLRTFVNDVIDVDRKLREQIYNLRVSAAKNAT